MPAMVFITSKVVKSKVVTSNEVDIFNQVEYFLGVLDRN